jgi:hypothetical protein
MLLTILHQCNVLVLQKKSEKSNCRCLVLAVFHLWVELARFNQYISRVRRTIQSFLLLQSFRSFQLSGHSRLSGHSDFLIVPIILALRSFQSSQVNPKYSIHILDADRFAAHCLFVKTSSINYLVRNRNGKYFFQDGA